MSQKFDINSSFKLNSGHSIPLLGYGVYQTPPDITADVVSKALKVGYRHVDSAAFYRNEKPCAEALVASGIPREQLYFTSKIPPSGLNYDVAKKQIATSIAAIGGLKYIDLMLLHAPGGGKEGRLAAWQAMADAVKEGKIRSIGVSNYGVHHLQELEDYIKAKEAKDGNGSAGVLSVNQIECHPWLQHKDIVSWCQQRGVLVEAWGPLARAARLEDPLLAKLSKQINKTPAQVLIRWSLQKGLSPLPKSVNEERIIANAKVFDFELSQDVMKELDSDEYDTHGWDPTTWD